MQELLETGIDGIQHAEYLPATDRAAFDALVKKRAKRAGTAWPLSLGDTLGRLLIWRASYIRDGVLQLNVDRILRCISPALLMYLLRERKITLLDPQSWDDRNDSRYLALYKERRQVNAVLALCFTEASETYHHWRVVANSCSGISIEFNRTELLSAVQLRDGMRADKVRYLKINNAESQGLKVGHLPFFAKRYPFHPKQEFRILFESKDDKFDTIDLRLPISCTLRITVSPWMPEARLSMSRKFFAPATDVEASWRVSQVIGVPKPQAKIET